MWDGTRDGASPQWEPSEEVRQTGDEDLAEEVDPVIQATSQTPQRRTEETRELVDERTGELLREGGKK